MTTRLVITDNISVVSDWLCCFVSQMRMEQKAWDFVQVLMADPGVVMLLRIPDTHTLPVIARAVDACFLAAAQTDVTAGTESMLAAHAPLLHRQRWGVSSPRLQVAQLD